MVERWHQLPLDHARSCLPAVQQLVQALADEVAGAESRPRLTVPDLGPAVVMDQLRVMVHDVMAVEDTPHGTERTTLTLAERLVRLRRQL